MGALAYRLAWQITESYVLLGDASQQASLLLCSSSLHLFAPSPNSSALMVSILSPYRFSSALIDDPGISRCFLRCWSGGTATVRVSAKRHFWPCWASDFGVVSFMALPDFFASLATGGRIVCFATSSKRASYFAGIVG